MPLSDEHSQLRDILISKSLLTGGDFTLASGTKSSEYVDGKLTTCFAQAMPLIGKVFLHKIRELDLHPQAVGGLTIGADPIAFAIAIMSLGAPPPINSFIVRKTAKEHGRHKFIEGVENPRGCEVIIIDDVCTKGGSTGQAIERTQEAGMKVIGVICLVDREQGASEYIQKKFGYTLHHIFTLAELRAHQRQHQETQVTMTV